MKRRFFFTVFIFLGLFSMYAETYGQLQNRISLVIEDANALYDRLPEKLYEREDWQNYGRYWAACEWLVENMDVVYMQLSGMWDIGYRNNWRRIANSYKEMAERISDQYSSFLREAELIRAQKREDEEDLQLFLNDPEAWYAREPEHDASFASTNMNFGHENTRYRLLAGGSRLN